MLLHHQFYFSGRNFHNFNYPITNTSAFNSMDGVNEYEFGTILIDISADTAPYEVVII